MFKLCFIESLHIWEMLIMLRNSANKISTLVLVTLSNKPVEPTFILTVCQSGPAIHICENKKRN